jgi:glycosyltransferase involved in cell wall biosynthesis
MNKVYAANEMERPADAMLSVEFEAAVVSPVTDRIPGVRPYTIGWFIQNMNVDSASTRYRCFHFARVLAPQFKSVFLTSLGDVQNTIRDLDAIIIVKRLDRAVLELAGLARHFNVPVFLDLCDDLIAPGYFKNELGINLVHFLGIAPLLAGVTVSSAEMGDRVESYAAGNGYPALSVHVIPDIAETWDIYAATFKTITRSDARLEHENPPARSTTVKQVVWFGNYGASHSNFGMFSLKPWLKALGAVHEEIPLELVIVSNNETVYRALVERCTFPTRYVAWSAAAVYSTLASADAALLTTGDDEFCSIKSSNRILQALAAGVPVITTKGPSLTEFEDVIFSGRKEDSLRLCLGPARQRAVPPRLAAAGHALARYQPERLGEMWGTLLKEAIESAREAGIRDRPNSVLIVVEPGDRLQVLQALLTSARDLPGLEYDLLMSTDVLESQPQFGSALALPRSIPRFFSGKLKGARNLLLDRSAVIVERPSAAIGKVLANQARQLGVPVLTSEAAASGGLKSLARKPASTSSESSIRAGPIEEWTKADGTVDWSFIVHQNARGWILDAICREIGSRQPNSWHVTYYPEPSPDAKNYFFSHYLLLENYAERHADKLQNANVFVWYTHPREQNPVTVARQLQLFEKVTKVIFACESNRQLWLDRGLPENKTAVVLGAADPKLFRFHERCGGLVGLSSSFYERKNPDCLLEVIKLLPHRNFLLLGRKWNQYALFEEMRAQPNFTYKSAPYRDYPDIYATFDVFLSMSSLEGGPIPLIEAMMSNAVPVASNTGFAPDLIRPGDNGFVFELDASAETIAEMIEAAFELPGNVRKTVEALDWDHFSAAVVSLAG